MRILKNVKLSSNSMHPILGEEKVIIKRIPSKNIRINDILVINDQNKHIAKRVIYKNKRTLILKGDNEFKSSTYNSDTPYKLVKAIRNGQNYDPEDIYKIQTLLYSNELTKLNSALRKQNINFLFLKGLPLSVYVTGKSPRRLYSDCDLLVNKKQWKRFERIVNSLGFKEESSARLNTPNSFKNKVTEKSFVKKINGLPIILDVHAEVVFMMNETAALNEFFPQSIINNITSSFLRNKKFVRIDNQILPILSDINLIFYLALHIFHHNYKGYNNYYFFDLVFRKTKINLTQLNDLINKTKTNKFLYPVFILYKKYYNPDLSEKFIQNVLQSQNMICSAYNTNIFDEQSRINAGINRFILLMILSPLPRTKRLRVLFNPSVIFSFFLLVVDVSLNKIKKSTYITVN